MAIEFRDNGTISVDIDGNTYTLRRPTMGQLWEFFDLRDELSDQATAKLREMTERLASLEDGSEEFNEVMATAKDRRFGFRYLSEPWLRKAFEELGSKPLPENLDDAPSELADPGLPNEILMFWREVPLAPSRRAT